MKTRKPKPNASLSKQIAYWDACLKKAGFEDIEDRASGKLRSWSGSMPLESAAYPESTRMAVGINPNSLKLKNSQGYSSLLWKHSQESYYRFAAQLLYEKEFKSERHRKIWELHCEGATLKKIAKKLKITPRQARYAVSTMQEAFGLKIVPTKHD